MTSKRLRSRGSLFILATLAAGLMALILPSDAYGVSSGSPTQSQLIELQSVINEIEQIGMRVAAHDASAKATIEADVDRLTNFLEHVPLDTRAQAVTLLYRGRARLLLDSLIKDTSGRYDLALARLADTDIHTAYLGFSKLKDPLAPEAAYLRAVLYYNDMGDKPAAMKLFSACADMKQMGCINVMANAYTAGGMGIEVDLNKAIALHKEVYDTGVHWRCAGIFSAVSIAMLYELRTVPGPQDNARIWLDRAFELLDRVEDKSGRGVCGTRAQYLIDRYLIDWHQRNRNRKILEDAADVHPPAPWPLLIEYLSDDITLRRFIGKVDAISDEMTRCMIYFDAVWAAENADDKSTATQLYTRLKSNECPFYEPLTKEFSSLR